MFFSNRTPKRAAGRGGNAAVIPAENAAASPRPRYPPQDLPVWKSEGFHGVDGNQSGERASHREAPSRGLEREWMRVTSGGAVNQPRTSQVRKARLGDGT